MQRQVFNYRVPAMYALVAFLTVWCTFWLVGIGANIGHPNVIINGRQASPEEALRFLWIAFAIGVILSLLDVFGILYILNTRVEIDEGDLFWYDFLGRQIVRGSIVSAQLTMRSGYGNNQKAVIQTEGGLIRVNPSISNFGLLTAIIAQHKSTASDESLITVQKSSYVPPVSSYNYRWTYLHLFSFFWLTVVVFMAVASQFASNASPFFLIGMIPFLGIGVWMQLKGWREKVEIGPDGIEWTDFLGRVRVKVALDQIVSVTIQANGQGSLIQIFTTEGTISAMNYLRNYRGLVAQVQQLVDSRPKDAVSAPLIK